MTGLHRIGVLGCGVMGSGIAQACGRAGLDVLVAVSSDNSLVAGRRRILRSLEHGVGKGRFTEAEQAATIEAVSFTTDLDDLADRQLVIESIPEHEPSKLSLLAALDEIVKDPDAIFASNTSSVPIVRLALATSRPERVIGMHFFNPVPVRPLVELTTSVLTDEQTYTRAASFVTGALGKEAIRSPDRAGFVVNGLVVPYLLSAIRMLEAGFADAETIDRGMVLGCAHPVGPIRLADLIGLDILVAVADALFEEFKEAAHVAPALLRRMVEGGLLGKKTGHGFYHYS